MNEINQLWVYYGDGEYTSNSLRNDQMAKEYAHKPENRPHWPLLVSTVEHGGWHMSHFFDEKHPDGICVGTANDRAVFAGTSEAIRERLFNAKRNYLPEVRRPKFEKKA